jgi:hypothetical protein
MKRYVLLKTRDGIIGTPGRKPLSVDDGHYRLRTALKPSEPSLCIDWRCKTTSSLATREYEFQGEFIDGAMVFEERA